MDVVLLCSEFRLASDIFCKRQLKRVGIGVGSILILHYFGDSAVILIIMFQQMTLN